MDVLHPVVVLVHLVAYAALLGGALVQLRTPDPEVNAAMLHGSWVSLVSGVALWVLAGPADEHPSTVLMVVKLVVSAFVTVLVVRNRRYLSVPRGLLLLVTGLLLAETALSVLGS